MNEQLKQLYESKWAQLVSATCSENVNAAYPLLLQVDGHYEAAKYRVMIVGQETDGWIGNFSDAEEIRRKPLDFALKDYFSYFYETPDKSIFNNFDERIKRKRKRIFWNKSNFKFFKSELEKELGKDNVAFVWNNLSKLGKITRGKATDQISNIENECFDVIRDEISILKPNVIIFTTGHARDGLIKQRFLDSSSETIYFDKASEQHTKKELARVKFTGSLSNAICFRTYHPNYWSGRTGRNKFISQAIIDQLKWY